ncbi:MAG: beta-aspartyl-peptidase [Clostridiaceae bacterium]
MILLKNADAFTPDHIGRRNILIAGNTIESIREEEFDTGNLEITEIECSNLLAVPGFIDGHVHILGGGGEGGFKTRTPELKMTTLVKSGVTTVVGCLGTDGITRTMENLIAKVYSLREEGVSAYCYTGSYQVPIRTLTGSVISDIMLLDPVIGVGEVAISDHRSSSPNMHEIARIGSEARVGGILSRKAGVVNCHMGDGSKGLSQILEVINETEIPITQFYPTHIARNEKLLNEAASYAKAGGYVDITTSLIPSPQRNSITSAQAFKILLDSGAPVDRITMTSDGQGSMPQFDENRNFRGMGLGLSDSLFKTVRESVIKHGVEMSQALKAITVNPSKVLNLPLKGQLLPGNDADIVLLEAETLEISAVISGGKIMMLNKELKCRDTFQ